MNNQATPTIHPAKAYLLDPNTDNSIFVKIDGHKRKILKIKTEKTFYITLPMKRTKFVRFDDWDSIDEVYFPCQRMTKEEEAKHNIKLIKKLKRLVSETTLSSRLINAIRNADLNKSTYENHITTGSEIDGQCISLQLIDKWYCKDGCSSILPRFWKAYKNKETWRTNRFPFRGFEGTLWCEPDENGMMKAGFNKEYKDCLNGFYYGLVNEKYMVGIDVD